MKIYVISMHQITDEEGKFVERPWITHARVFTCKEHAEMEIKILKSLQTENELYAYVIDKCILLD